MNVFVTGASGWIGSAVVAELRGAGHAVTGLARSDTAAAAIESAGAKAVLGTIDDLDLLQKQATESDGVIHLAFKHDVAFAGDFGAAARADRLAVEAFGDALAGSDRALVIASGTLGVAPGAVATERDEPPLDAGHGEGPAMRQSTAQFTVRLAERGIRSCVLRLPPTNHGDGDNGFIKAIVGFAREKGASPYVGDGSNRWPAVHRLDSARLFRLACEQAPAGSVLHGVAEEGVAFRSIAEVIGRHLDVPSASITPEEAPAHFSFLAAFVAMDGPASSRYTRELLGWEPVQPGLLADLDAGHYFR